tara:strand:+ start:3873 stop:4841 length:969 start_codon:yes stop_codon:yes gene_type:complete
MRDLIIANALHATPWAKWSKSAIAGDASARRYFRLTQAGTPAVIVMDDPTFATNQFADIAVFLSDAGFAAPEILHHDATIGFMIISDLGHSDFATHLRTTPQDEAALYQSATQILCNLHTQKTKIPLGTIDHSNAAHMIDLAALHYAPDPLCKDELEAAMHSAYAVNVDPTPHIALRDFHAENLIWRPDQSGQNRVGLLDFQDACHAPAGYDLMSLLHDARRDIGPGISQNCIAQFCAATDTDPVQMSAHLACVSAQRNLRILGIFARLAHNNGKLKYLRLLPRVWSHLMTDLAHPALADLRKVVIRALPPPDAATLQRLQP